MPSLGQEAISANPGLLCKDDPPYCFVEYHDGEFREKDIDIEFCEAVQWMGTDTPRLKFKRIKAVPQAACVLHKGPYASLGQAYAALFAWIDNNGYQAAGNPREAYIDGIWNHENSAEWLTEIQVPIQH
jgi:effector-binding domain-containing protein